MPLVHKLSDAGFPLSLQVFPTGDVPLKDYDGWTTQHNQIVSIYAHNPDHSSLRKGERAILSLATALNNACNVWADPFAGEYVIKPLYDAFSNALDQDTGRIQAGRGFLSEWAGERVRAAGVDPETGEWIGEDDGKTITF